VSSDTAVAPSGRSTASLRMESNVPMLPLSRRQRILVTLGVMVGMFLAAMESTVVSTAMPTVVATLGGIERFSWVFSGYLLTATITMPLWGKLSDLYGRRTMYQIGVAVFLVGSFLCGAAMTMNQLIAFRVVQGIGAGALVPIALTIIGEIYTVRERTRMQGVFSSVWGIASIIGPLAGGYITETFSWRWVFFINLPFGIVAAIIIGMFLTEPARTTRPSIDVAGAVSLTAAITLVLIGLTEGAQFFGWMHPATLGAFALAGLLLVAFVAIEKRATDPIVPMDLLQGRVIAISTISGILVGMALFGTMAFIPLFAQGVLGVSATTAGSALTPLLLCWVLASVVGGRIMHATGLRNTVALGLGLVMAGFFILTTFGKGSSMLWLMADLGLMGAGMGLSVFTLLVATQASVERERLGIATSLTMFARTIGGSIGVSVLGSLLASGLATRMLAAGVAPGTLDPNRLLEPAARATLSAESVELMSTALDGSLHIVFWIGAVVAAAAFLTAFMLPKRLTGDVSLRPAAAD